MNTDIKVRWICIGFNDRGQHRTFVVWASCFSDACIIACTRHLDHLTQLVSIKLCENDEPVYKANCL